ncbi:MAG: thioredoxin family protein [Pseudomonadota bacterium]
MNATVRYVAVVKSDCPTCRLAEPALAMLAAAVPLEVYRQDGGDFPTLRHVLRDDRALDVSYRHQIDIVPTLVRFEDGAEVNRVLGWDRAAWQTLTGLPELGAHLIAFQPGCGSLSTQPGIAERLALEHGAVALQARQVGVPPDADVHETMYEHGWSDGLPLIPPTDLRIARMLGGTSRSPDDIVGLIPPNLVECTVEKVAINAVMAGCRPEYLPLLLTTIEAALEPEFSLHGLLCTTWFSGPAVIVNGPVSRRIGINSGHNCLGQGTRANSTIGRALQLLIRNVGGGRPMEIDRSVFGHPGKVGFCFAEDESDPDWMPLHVARGFRAEDNAVTLFHADGVHGLRAHRARGAAELARSLAAGLVSVTHPKLYGWGGAILLISPDHFAIFKREGWDRGTIESALLDALRRPRQELAEGVGGIAEGAVGGGSDDLIDKFHAGTLLVMRAGGGGSLISAVIGGWPAMRRQDEVKPVTRLMRE